MREMKDSGISWLGQYPANWELIKIKYCLQDRVEKNNPIRTRQILSLTAKQGVIPYDQKEGGGNKPKEDVSAYRLAYPGDIVMNSMNILSGSVGLSQYFGCVSPVYYMLRPRNKAEDVRYYNYIFQTIVFQRSLFGLGNGILIKESSNGNLNTIRMRIPMDKFGGLFIPVAPIKEQQRIAEFLDQKCSEIDSLVADIQSQIETLEQYKKSVITEAVTKGLDTDVEMKDSGIEWIGEIPRHWEVPKTLYVLEMPITDGPHTTPQLYDEGIPFISAEAISSGKIDFNHKRGYISEAFYKECCLKYTPKRNDIYMVKSGATTGRVAMVETDEIFTIWSPLAVFRANQELMISRYLFYFVQAPCYTGQVENSWSFGTQQNIGMRVLEKLKVCMPTLEEQQRIADYLDQKCTAIDETISAKQDQLSVLEQYKKSLIYEYVTGKKEVPHQ